ncbi:TetR/AcrR family transcriptional regulator [Pseudomonas sp. 5P_5.1_Bac1]|uniref:TetR/AcrR family transcriptional regulator n=1 Tax=Pseudomonas sp. 5P_5.1_Bac1 TaxID=2971616 RepID=UPI0021C584CD|nr:TetR/AcrR family transcriptional regulator [Pseudomonas sp. 5P_5.1_Bac1]MCU1725130.1 TetR/AcrR family transcriptional regulator [Pseudomonas sp. 5P_5.1_Bac1]
MLSVIAVTGVRKGMVKGNSGDAPPPQASRRHSREKEIKSDMLRAASDLFVALGHDLTNMQLIADSAGVTKATLYAHFGSKSALFRAVVDYWMEALPEPALPALAQGGLRSSLEKVAGALLKHVEHPASIALTQIMMRSNWIPPKRWRQRYRQYQVYVEKALWQCARCEDPVRVARQFLVLAVGSVDPGTAAHIDETRITAAVALMCLAYE